MRIGLLHPYMLPTQIVLDKSSRMLHIKLRKDEDYLSLLAGMALSDSRKAF